jgi:hypothetical protein
MEINFDEIDDVQDFTPLPAGRYRCRLAGIEESSTEKGAAMWRMSFVVLDGPFAGRRLFDNLPFSAKALKRVKLVFSRLGLPTTGVVDVTPALALNKTCYLTAEVEEYTDSENHPKKRNKIPFEGYEKDSNPSATGAEPQGRQDEDAF